MWSSSIIIVILSFILTFKGFKAALVRRFNYDARLFEHFSYDSRYIQYSRTDAAEWADIYTMSETRNFTFQSMVCTYGPGAWLLYPDINYGLGNRVLYYLVIGEHCVRTDDIGSVQPLGKMDEILDKGVLLFTKENFGSAATLIEGAGGDGQARSIIFAGPDSFEFSSGGEKYCVTPEEDDEYCLIPDLKSSLKIEGSITIVGNCSEAAMMDPKNLITAHNCYEDGVHEIYSDTDFSVDKLKEICSEGGTNFDKAKFAIVMDLWGKRIENANINPSMNKPNPDPITAMKLGVIWDVLNLFTRMCPAMDPTYMYLLGSLFEIHLENAWGMPGAVDKRSVVVNFTETEEYDWSMVAEWTKFCDSKVGAVYVGTGCRSAEVKGRDNDDGDATFGDEWYKIINGYAFDTVIEQMWLIINAFIPECANIQQFSTNDWNDLILLFNSHFLEPLTEIWADPDDWQRVYATVFHGFDVREEHQNILDCLKAVLVKTPAFDPIGRPKSFRDFVTYEYLVPMFGKIEKLNKKTKGVTNQTKNEKGARKKRTIPSARNLGKSPKL